MTKLPDPRIKCAINSPRYWRGQEIDRDQSAQASSLNPAPQLAAEAEGGAGTQDGQGAWGLEGVGKVVELAYTVNIIGVSYVDLSERLITKRYQP